MPITTTARKTSRSDRNGLCISGSSENRADQNLPLRSSEVWRQSARAPSSDACPAEHWDPPLTRRDWGGRAHITRTQDREDPPLIRSKLIVPAAIGTEPRRRSRLRMRVLIAILATLGVTGALGVVAGTQPATEGQASAAQGRPNVLVIETDDQTAESMRIMNNVNALIGSEGVTFKNSFANYSLCCPSRATFLTGQYVHNHGVLSTTAPSGGFDRFESLHGNNNIPPRLRDPGHTTPPLGQQPQRNKHRTQVPPG